MAMELVDYLRSGALVVGFLATTFLGTKTALTADMIISLAHGVAFFLFPGTMLGFRMVGDLDAVMVYFARVAGVMYICAAIFAYRTRKSEDDTVKSTVFLSRFVSSVGVLLAMADNHYKASKKDDRLNDQNLYFGVLGLSLWSFQSAFNFLRMKNWGGHSAANNCINKHLLFDYLCVVSVGLCCFAFPDYQLTIFKHLKTPNSVHLFLVRGVGAVAIGFGFMCLRALNFASDADKRSYMLARLAMYPLIWATVGFHQYFNSLVSMRVMYTGLAFGSIAMINLAAGYFQFTSVCKPKKQ